ncbi:MAG: hypothetical protein EXQ88_04530 [Alphaproteobacteria bacterium]|nr:hypothetical protein [Alphaproteobacteria bacterium]
MTIDRLGQLLDAYGGELARWPAEARGAAQTLLAGSSEARALLLDAQRLDEALAIVRPPRPNAAVATRLRDLIGGAVDAPASMAVIAARPLTRPLAGFALAASFVLGVTVGAYVATRDLSPPAAGGALADWAAGAPNAETIVVIGLVDAEPWPYDTRISLTLY